MHRVLVTGGSGFIGRHALAALKGRAENVHAVSTRSVEDAANVRWHRADLLDAGAVDSLLAEVRPSHLLHLAWFSDRREIYRSFENRRWAEASYLLLEAFERYGGERTVFAGSCAEYDWSEGICSEWRTPLEPATLYGTAKVELFERFQGFVEERRLSGAWARIFFLYGPGEHPNRLLPSVIRSILAGEPARCTHGNQVRDYLYAGDVADALVTLLASSVTGPINVGSGEGVALKDLVLEAAGRLGRPELVQLGAIPAPEGEAPLVQAEVGRLVGEVGWHLRFGLDKGLAQTIEYWRAAL